MDIESYARWWLEQEGDYIERMHALGGTTTAQNNAKQQVIGINFFCKHILDKAEIDTGEEGTYKYSDDGTRELKEDIWLTIQEAKNQDPLIIMEKMGLDPTQWKLEWSKLERRKWDTAMKLKQEDGTEKPEVVEQFSFGCHVKVTPLQDVITTDIIREVIKDINVPKLKEYDYQPGSQLFVDGLVDPHLGKHAWGDETGEGHYDLDIASDVINDVRKGFLSRLNGNIEKIVLPVGQDYYHIDDKDELTTAGTHVDTDGRWQKIYKRGVDLLIWAVEHYRKVAPVEVIYVPGNHDEMLSYAATVSLAHKYDVTDSVTVNLSPEPRKYVEYGRNLLGFSHGKNESKKRLEKVMQVEQPESWGRTRYREFLLGDLHHEKTWESGGIVFRRIPAVTETDAWHNEKGYIGAIRRAQGFIYDRDYGLDTIINSVVKEEREEGE